MQKPKTLTTKDASLRSKITAVALGAILTFSFGFILIEAFRPTATASVNETYTGKESALEEANFLQAGKIKQLNEELLSAERKLQEFQTALFSRTNPQDRAKIADLTEELYERQGEVKALTVRLQELQNESVEEKKAVRRLEQTSEALALMIEKERGAKEEISQRTSEEMALIRTTALKEKTELMEEIASLEETKNALELQVKDRALIFEKTTETLASLEKSLSEKTTLLEQLTAEAKDTKALFAAQIEDVARAMEKEKAVAKTLESDIELAKKQESAQLEWAKQARQELSSKEEALQKAQSKETELTELLAFYKNSWEDIERQYNATAQSLKDEQTKNEALANALRETESGGVELTALFEGTEKRLKDLELALTEKESQLSDISARLETMATHHRSYQEEVSQKLEEKEAELLRAVATLEALNGEKSELAYLIDDHKARENDHLLALQTREAELNEVQERVQSLVTNLEEWAERAQGKDVVIAELSEALQQATQKIQTMEETVVANDDAAATDRHQSDLLAMEAHLEAMSLQNKKLQEALKKEQARQNGLREGQEELYNHFMALDAVRREHEEALRSFRAENEQLLSENRTMEKRHDELVELLDQTNHKLMKVASNVVMDVAEREPINLGSKVKTYKVQQGDSLKSISEEMYGTRDRWIDIYDANQDKIDDIGNLKSGIVLEIP